MSKGLHVRTPAGSTKPLDQATNPRSSSVVGFQASRTPRRGSEACFTHVCLCPRYDTRGAVLPGPQERGTRASDSDLGGLKRIYLGILAPRRKRQARMHVQLWYMQTTGSARAVSTIAIAICSHSSWEGVLGQCAAGGNVAPPLTKEWSEDHMDGQRHPP